VAPPTEIAAGTISKRIDRRRSRQYEKPAEFIVILCMAQSAGSVADKKEDETVMIYCLLRTLPQRRCWTTGPDGGYAFPMQRIESDTSRCILKTDII